MIDQIQEVDPAEAIAELLGDPLPTDWRDACAVQARQDHLTALACDAAEAAVEWLVHTVTEAWRGQGVSSDDQRRGAFVDAVVLLEREWRRYVHDTQRDDARAIVYRGAEFFAGSLIATVVEGSLEKLRAEYMQAAIDAARSHTMRTAMAEG